MKNRHPVHPIEVKRAEEPHELPHLRLLKQLPAAPSERQRQEEDELRSLIKALQRCESQPNSGKYQRSNYRSTDTEDDLPPAA